MTAPPTPTPPAATEGDAIGPLVTGPLATGAVNTTPEQLPPRRTRQHRPGGRPGRGGPRRRVAAGGDDRGSMPMALLLIMVGMALAAALLPTMLVQDRATVFDGSRLDNLAAAQAGQDAVIGQFRAAVSAGSGDTTQLPCPTASHPITGRVNTVGKAAYSVYVSYFVNDPVANPPPPAGTNQPMLCVPGDGTYDQATTTYVPSYALITSTGTDGATPTGPNTGASTGRTLISTYAFQTSTRNAADGFIEITPYSTDPTVPNMCMDAGSQPAAGTNGTLGTIIVLQPCNGANQQLFAYRSDLTLQLVTLLTPTYPNGLCLDTNTTPGATAPSPVAGNPVYLATCQALGNPPYSQQWSFNDNGGFQAALPTSRTDGNLSGLCMAVSANQPAGNQVTLANCDGNVNSTQQAWFPAPNAGDGAAAAPQLVNDQQFGRCLDILAKSESTTYLIAYPCKQNPNASAVAFNQKFTFDPTSGWLYTNDPGGSKYCVYSPLTEGGLPVMTPCTTPGTDAHGNQINPNQLIWTMPGSSTSVAVAQRYTIVDSSGRCLGIDTSNGTSSATVLKIVVTACNGTAAQKWNADPQLGVPGLQNVREK